MRKGWEIKRLGDVAKAIYGYTDKASFEKVGPKFLRITDIQDDGVNWESIPYCRINEIEFEKYKLSSGDIVFARTGATTGKSYLVENPPKSVFASYLIKVHISTKDLLPNYLFLFFQTKTYWDKINAGVSGSAQGGFNATKLSELEIPFPPTKEQQQIVSILDEAFAAIDQAKENVQRNLLNAKELFQSELNIIFENKGEGWTEKKLNEVCEVKDGTHDSPKYLEKGIPFVTQKNIRESGLSFGNTRFITQTDHDKFFNRSNVSYGDILLSMIGANRGMACIVDDKRVFSIKNVCLIKANENINQNYLLYYLKSQKAINFVKTSSKGGAQEFIGLTELRNFPTPLAPLKVQKKIVNQLDTLSTETKNLENIYQQKLNALEELKKSILQKAFSGELTLNKKAVVS